MKTNTNPETQSSNEEQPQPFVKFDFENTKAGALNEISKLQDGSNVLNPVEAGKVYSLFITAWSFEGDPKDPNAYANLSIKDYAFVMRNFLEGFRGIFGSAD